MDQDAFLRELLGDFRIEAAEHHQAIVLGLLNLEKNPASASNKADIETVFREIHSLKGAARAVNLLDIERLCMAMESVFHEMKKGNLTLMAPAFDVLLKTADVIKIMLSEIDSNQKTIQHSDLMQYVKNLDAILSITKPLPKLSITPPPTTNAIIHDTAKAEEKSLVLPIEVQSEPISTNKILNEVEKPLEPEIMHRVSQVDKISDRETVRVTTEKLYKLLRQAEEMIAVKSTLKHYVSEIQNTANQYAAWNRKFSETSDLFISGKSIDGVENIRGLVAQVKEFSKLHENDILNFDKNLAQFQRVTSRMIDDLLLDVKTTLLYPFSSLLAFVPKIVRDLCKDHGKEIDLQIEGGDTEIDRRILEEIKDPLIHLIRNCIDHGIELPVERISKGKPATGILKISISQDADSNVTLRISDDGAGINRNKVIASAVKMGILKSDDARSMSDQEIAMLIFSSGLSTSPFITDISGRGLGMAIVAEKVIKLGGTITLDTQMGAGSTFTITLPQTLATFRGVLIKASEQQFIIPTTSVVKAIRIAPLDIKSVESKKTICFNGETIALVSITDVLNLPLKRSKKNQKALLHVLVLSLMQKKIAFIADEVLGEHEGMLKDLGSQLLHVTNIAGATLLGNGRVIPILHIPELFESASRSLQSGGSMPLPVPENEQAEMQQKRILVAEDSITIRSMLRNFLETAGYVVKTAVDGQEAFGFLQNESFDLVVSDIEMPHVNGFVLTAKIREDKSLSEMPVILVTALETAEDRQRGLNAGANAYIIKSSFEQSNLVETIKRLI